MSYQADYLDIKGLNIKNEKILKDLTNIMLLTNKEGSSCFSTMILQAKNLVNDWDLRTLLFSLVGVPLPLFRAFYKMEDTRKEIDMSCLSKEIREKIGYKRTTDKIPSFQFYMNRDLWIDKSDKEKERNIVGVIFLHTLLFKSEIEMFLCSLKNIFGGRVVTEREKVILKTPSPTLYINRIRDQFARFYEYQVDMDTLEKKEKFKEESFEPKLFTIFIPIYEPLDFIQPSLDIYSKKTLFKEHSMLNWCLPKSYKSKDTIDQFGSKEGINNVSVNFTYFPSEINKTYYNKYVETLAFASPTNLTKFPILNSCFCYIEGKKAEKAYEEITSFFSFPVFPENLINVTELNQYTDTFLREEEKIINYMDYGNISGHISSSRYIFIIQFLPSTLLFKYLLSCFDCDSITRIPDYKKAIGELINEMSRMKDIYEKYNIGDIFPISLSKTLLHFLYYFYIIDTVEERFIEMSRRITSYMYTGIEKEKIGKEVYIGSFFNNFNKELQEQVVSITRFASNEETISIISKAIELYYSYLKDTFISFLILNKDFKEIIESYKKGEDTEYIAKKAKDFEGKEKYLMYGGAFFMRCYTQFHIKRMDKQFQSFIDTQISKKLKTPHLKKQLPEYRLYYILLKMYRFFPITTKKCTFGKNTFTFMNWFSSEEYNSILNSRVSFEEHIKIITTNLETNFNFSR